MRTKTKYPLLYVRWLDACSIGKAGWKTLRKAKKNKPAVFETVGWLVKEDRHVIKLVSSIEHGGNLVDGDVVIPKGWLLKRKKL